MLRKEKSAFIFLLLCVYTLYAQEENRFKAGIELGPAKGADFGLLVSIEPRYNISENSTLGLRLGGAIVLGRNLEELVESKYSIEEGFDLHEVFSLAATFDKYLGKANSKFQPFIGGGIGYFKSSRINRVSTKDNPDVNLASTTKVCGKIGLLIRSGFVLGKFRLGLEYNIIPKAKIQMPNGDIAGSVKDSYSGASIGCIFGGGKN